MSFPALLTMLRVEFSRMNSSVRVGDAGSSDVVAFESRIDQLYLNLPLLRYPRNLALWALVTTSLEYLYRPEAQQSPDQDRTDQAVVSRSLGLFLRQIRDYPFRGHAPIKSLRLGVNLREVAAEASQYARFWFAATGYFPDWHQGECAASIIGPNAVRFEITATKEHRAVSAYQKAFRRASMRVPTASVYAPIPEWIHAEYSRALVPGTTKDSRLIYKAPDNVYVYYRDWYAQKMREAVEHPTDTDLGSYDIGDAIRFWSTLAAFSATHDYLCYAAGRRSHLPTNSILVIRKRTAWADEIARLSGLDSKKCNAILNSIIVRPRSVIDLHVTPFLPLDDENVWLALVAPLAITGRFDQNLLRICSAEDPARFNRITPNKERWMRNELAEDAEPCRIRCLGPVSLPSLPDIDMLFEDLANDTVMIAELKWVRPPIGYKSRIRGSGELMRGLDELRQIREFVLADPDYLTRSRRLLSKALSQFTHVYFCVIARGHLVYVQPTAAESLIPFDAMKFALKAERRLDRAMDWILRASWLPEEDIDYRVRVARFAHQGRVIEAPVFTPPSA